MTEKKSLQTVIVEVQRDRIAKGAVPEGTTQHPILEQAIFLVNVFNCAPTGEIEFPGKFRY